MLLNVNLEVNFNQNGGSVTEMIRSMNTNMHEIKSVDDQYKFTFNDRTKNKNRIGASSYLGAGGFTGVFSIAGYKTNPSILQSNDLILRVLYDMTDINKYIEKYNADLVILPQNVPLHYMYGELRFNTMNGSVTKQYVIVKRYTNSDEIADPQFPLKKKVVLIKTLLQTIKTLQDRRLYLKDLKFDNIGCDENGVYIILDYDETTIFNIKDIRLFTYMPLEYIYYMTKPSISFNPNKLYSLGLANIMIQVFGTNSADIMPLFYPLAVSGEPNWAKDLLQTYVNTIEESTLKNAIFKLQMDKSRISLIDQQNIRIYILYLIGIPVYTGITEKGDAYFARVAQRVPTIEYMIDEFNRMFPDGRFNKYLKMKEKYIKLKQLLY
jgi:hypothetical protein